MSIIIYTGLPGSGKTVKLAKKASDLLWRNFRWYQKTGIKRRILTNIELNPEVLALYPPGFVETWQEPEELVKFRHVDILWDEIATHLDSTQWQNVPLELKRWLQQHRKFGIDLFCTTQDFGMVDISVRRLTSELYKLTKIFGSLDISATRPKIKRVFGLVLCRELDPLAYKPESVDKQKRANFWFSFVWISKKIVNFFDTTQEIKAGGFPKLKHIERECADLDCKYHKVIHV